MSEEQTIEIDHRPIKKIVVFECVEMSNEEFFKRIQLLAVASASAGQPTVLNWAEGILFLMVPYEPNSETVIKKTLEGTLFISAIVFTPMKKYEPIKKIGSLEIPIIDQSISSNDRQIAQWLKKRLEK